MKFVIFNHALMKINSVLNLQIYLSTIQQIEFILFDLSPNLFIFVYSLLILSFEYLEKVTNVPSCFQSYTKQFVFKKIICHNLVCKMQWSAVGTKL